MVEFDSGWLFLVTMVLLAGVHQFKCDGKYGRVNFRVRIRNKKRRKPE